MGNRDQTIGVVSAVFGDFDPIPPLPSGFDVNVLVTDAPVQTEWNNEVMANPIGARLASKLPKMRPDLFLKADILVWVDATFRERTPGWLAGVASSLSDSEHLALFPHPKRTTVSEEIEVSEQLFKYQGQPLRQQYEAYRHDGFSDSGGLWQCGVMVRRNTEEMRNLGTEWLLQNLRWSLQDQVSFPFVLERSGFRPRPLDQSVRRSGQVVFVSHKVDDYSFPRSRMENILARLRQALPWSR